MLQFMYVVYLHMIFVYFMYEKDDESSIPFIVSRILLKCLILPLLAKIGLKSNAEFSSTTYSMLNTVSNLVIWGSQITHLMKLEWVS